MIESEELSIYPGGDLVLRGLEDLERGDASVEALLLMIAARRLRRLGFTINPLPNISHPYEHALFGKLQERNPARALVEYNALIGRIVSFAQTYGRGKG